MILPHNALRKRGLQRHVTARATACSLFLIIAFSSLGCGKSEFQADRRFKTTPSTTPENWKFWWGISASSYQTEDAGPHSENLGFETDWDLAAFSSKLKGTRGNATWSYTQTQRDIAALKQLGATHYRFSIEWARVEPKPGEFNEAAIRHYVQFVKDLRAAGITPLVSLWHLTLPAWLISSDPRQSGWLHPDMPMRWHAYVERMAVEFTPLAQNFCPQNEPNTYALGSLIGYFPPGKSLGYEDYLRTQDRQADAFIDAARILRDARPDVRIIAVQSITHWERNFFDPMGGFWYAKGRENNYYHLDQITDYCDWIGINYYMVETATPLMNFLRSLRSGDGVSDCGWQVDADGLVREIAEMSKRYGKPMLITENGISTTDDRKRSLYLLKHVNAVRRARMAGHDVRGYFHWSLIDNYEWADGYEEKFGLYEMDAKTLDLIPKKSASLFRSLATEKRGMPLAPIPPSTAKSASVTTP